MPQERNLEELTIKNTRFVIPTATPDSVMSALGRVLKSCILPPPFKKGTRVEFNHWSPITIETKLSLPIILWKTVHSSTPQSRPKEISTHIERLSSGSAVEVFQQDFHHEIQFECYASSQEDASALYWWLVNQIYVYKYILADAGAQHIRYLESREDFLATVAIDKYPARSVRFVMTTSLLFRSARSVLNAVDITAATDTGTWTVDELIIKGEDQPSEPYVSCILEVTSEDGEIQYDVTYNPMSCKFVWLPGHKQPVDGVSYRVKYLAYAVEPTRYRQVMKAEVSS